MNRGRKAFLLVFALNSISLYIYFSVHNPKPQPGNHPIVTENHKPLTGNNHSSSISSVPVHHAKPWPILPSYLPWSLNPNVHSESCEGYFGNGFNRRIDLIRSSERRREGSAVSNYGGGGDGWFRCLYSETLESSICESGGIRMNPEKIKMAVGGEKLETVIGRSEEEEMPVFDVGAFDIGVNERINGDGRKKLVNEEFLDRFVPRGDVDKHTMRSLIDSIQLVNSDEFNCSQWVEEPTLLVTRFEYANVFHTFTDWYSAYVASRVTGVPNRPHLVFLDGHCKAQLEETWEALFSSLRYAKNFSGSVCFRHAILSPLGYETALFKGLTHNIHCQGAQAHDLWQNPVEEKTARLSEFGEMIRASFGFQVERNRVAKPVSSHSILFVRREDYLAHPRHGGRVESRLINEEEVFDAIKDWVDNHLNCEVNLINGLFAHMPMKEQVRAIQDASVIIGAHGAGLTHIVAAAPKAVVLELISSLYRRPHFALISQWRGLEYHAINLVGSYAEPEVVIDKLNSIMSNLGC